MIKGGGETYPLFVRWLCPTKDNMTEEQLKKAAEAAYDAWWAAQEGRDQFGWLRSWVDLTEAEKEFYVVFVQSVEDYISNL